MASLFAELKRRNVLRVAAAYAVVSWILIEAGSVLLPTFGAPEWVFKAYVLVVIGGFALSLVLAWVFEVTPEGVKLEKDVVRSESITRKTGRKLDTTIIGLLAIALAISVTLNIAGLRGGPDTASTSGDRYSIAVLPFTNRSADPDNAFFADGIHDDLLTSLSNIKALKVISRTSVLKYRGTDKNMRQIAAELGVDTIMEGSVQRVGDNVRINVQLIDAITDEHIWAKIYDRAVSTENIFAIQSAISAEISGALEAQLTPEEEVRLATAIVPTKNLEAYRLVTAGRRNLYERRLETLTEARGQFERAIELDPEYAKAYSGLADSLMLLFINHQAIPMDEAFGLAAEALDEALELDDQDPDAYASLGLLNMDHWKLAEGSGEDAEAVAEEAFLRALELNPNHARALMWFASLRASQERIDEAIDLYNRSLEVDPLGRIPYNNLPGLYAFKGRNNEALDKWLEAVRIHPDWSLPYGNIAGHLQRLGRLDESLAWAVRSAELSTDPLAGGNTVGVYLEFGESERALAMFKDVPDTHPLAPTIAGFVPLFSGDIETAAKEFAALAESDQSSALPKFVLAVAADSALLAGNFEKSLEFTLRQNESLSDDAMPKIDRSNIDSVIRYAFLQQNLGNDSERGRALLEAALPVVRTWPRLGSAGHGINDVHILALLGRPEEALAALRTAVDEGFRGTFGFNNWPLAFDPYLTALAEVPGYSNLLAEIGEYVAVMRERALAAEAAGDWDALLNAAQKKLALARGDDNIT